MPERYFDPKRVEARYHNATAALDRWRKAQEFALAAEVQVKAFALLADRDRDFQQAGLNRSGTAQEKES